MRVPVRIVGIQADTPEDDPIVMLRERTGDRVLGMWIGEQETALLTFAMAKTEIPRPFTHTTLWKAIQAAGAEVESVCVTAQRDGIFWAEIVLDNDRRVDSRPSDALILAATCGCEITVEDSVLNAFGVVDPRGDELASGSSRSAAENCLQDFSEELPDDLSGEIDAFREMLDHLSMDDFLDGPEDEQE